ncbi:MFS transporter [Candidatus Saccharibacteria bacterium]|nr:MAG: MFS transporter [Candidatus Saccharibacteria bacterium]
MARVSTPRQTSLERNIIKYAWYKVVTKRVFLPLIAIQLVNAGQVTVGEIAQIAIITSLAQIILQLPTGYFADRFGNKRAIVIGALIAAPSPLFYIVMPNFLGGLLASLLFFGGWAFQSGAIEAFIHDTLIALKREKDYTRVMGRSQSFGLIGNIVLITLVPMTYELDTRLPFLIGTLSLVTMVWLAISLADPHIQQHRKISKNPLHALRAIGSMANILLFLFAGFMAAINSKSGEYTTLLFQSLGVAVTLFGAIQALSSLLGAGLGFITHWFDRMSARTFYLFDLIVTCLPIIIMGWSRDPVVVVAASVVLLAYYRIRLIVVQSKLLASMEHTYKSTMLSALSLFTPLSEVAAVTILAYFIHSEGYSNGYLSYGLAVLGIGIVLLIPLNLALKRR